MDIHSQLSKNMDDIVALFQARTDNFDKALSQTQNKSPSQNSQKVYGDLATLSSDYCKFKDFVCKTLSMLRKQIQLLTEGYDMQEACSRRKILLFHGLPETADECPETVVLNVLHEQLKLPSIDTSMIDISHRLGAIKSKPRPILVRFSNLKMRNLVWNNKTSLKGSTVTMSEFLTKPRQEIFTAARKHFGIKNCWTTDGVIMVILPDKTRRKVVTVGELQLLVSNYPQPTSSKDPKPSRLRRGVKNLVK